MDKKPRKQAIEELSLMLLYLTRFQERNEFCRYLESSWKGYDFETLNELERRELLVQPKKSKRAYVSEEGKEAARKLLAEYCLSDLDMLEKFEFREIEESEAGQAAEIEQICFPPNEACSEKCMRAQILAARQLFLVAVDKETGKIAGFLNGIATDEPRFRDAFFTDARLHDPEGKNIMLLGLDVLPEYRGQGLGRELVYQYLRKERENGRQEVFLTCLEPKVKMYQKFGFTDRGIANSSWGGETWHEMSCVLGW